MASTISTRRRTPQKQQQPECIKKMAWYMTTFVCQYFDEIQREKMREMLSYCRGTRTTVSLSSRDGWKSGKSSAFNKHKKRKAELSQIYTIERDDKFVNILFCVFRIRYPDTGQEKFEVVAYKFRSCEDADELVRCFETWTLKQGQDRDSIHGSVMLPRPTTKMMPGRPTTGSLVASQWATTPRRYISSSVGDLTSSGVFYETTGARQYGNGRLVTRSGRAWGRGEGSIIESDLDTADGVAVAHVNGRLSNGGAGSLSPVDYDTSPVHLVYERAPSVVAMSPTGGVSLQRRDRYLSAADVVSLNQGDSRSLGRYPYQLTGSRSDICSVVSGTGSRLMTASQASRYHHNNHNSATLINPRYHKQKQYVKVRS